MKRLIVTGASSGVGRAVAELFLKEGWSVGLIARRADALHQIATHHDNAVVLPADVTDAQALEAAFDSFGAPDVLFNNAGIFGPSAPIDEIAIEDWEQVLMVNLHGMFLAARLAFGAMRRSGGGRIINNGSISAHTPRAGSVCYTTTKHAITGLTKSLSLDGRPFDIACGQIDIGNAETEMVANLKKRDPDLLTMDVSHAANAVLHMALLPPEANVQFMTVMATKMPYIGRG
ncbi:SDR family NAD(P)-dependent oxidoreductase [Sulfitobacter sp. F26204]|uniref:SDR family oxidoreductase n=1 Tax=Sulfitobacter sp. F26204 TaxID=2996014 RepID=UPI00225E36C9|nr:SDR family oxidoreductase [Sulfitobacter sp. F26204]MCX7561059.1 SDR family NAD(P)-dependent oxidoreductase [Sulfitobacter sp. F26204]